MSGQIWNQCLKCGRFISLEEYDSGDAERHVEQTEDGYTVTSTHTTCHYET